MSLIPEIFCVDPGLETPEFEAYSEISKLGSLSFSHHLPARKGMASLYEREKEVDLKGIIIFGSMASVNDGLPWQKELHPWIQKKLEASVPILGICYGHQLIAHLCGGSVDLVESKTKFLTIRKVEVLGNCPLKPMPSHVKIVASHIEEVKKVPADMEIFARSKDVSVEGLYHKKYPIITFQTHPEARGEFCKGRGIKFELEKDPFRDGRSILASFVNYVENY